MKTLFTFYSFEGNCLALSSVMAEAAGGDLAALVPENDVPRGAISKYFMGGKASLFKETTLLKPLDKNIRDYDLVVVGGPVWFLDITPAVRTFLTANDWKGVTTALFAMHRGGKGKAVRTMRRLVEERGGTVAGTAEFVDLRRGTPDDTRKRAIEWIAGLTQQTGDNHD